VKIDKNNLIEFVNFVNECCAVIYRLLYFIEIEEADI